MSVMHRCNVSVSGKPDARPMMFAHGYGCDQHMWREVAPAFADTFRVILFDLVGAGGSDLSAYDAARYGSLQGYADDVLEICDALDLDGTVFVGHSVSAMIGALAVAAEPHRFSGLVMVGPSPRYVNDDGYIGGFEESDIEELLESIDANYLGWSTAVAPVIMGRPDRPELGRELTESFCRTDPTIARQFARVTFLSDNRKDLARVNVPTLVLQCSDDVLAPIAVGRYVADRLPDATLVQLSATGHCPHLSEPAETIRALRQFIDV
jgi:sigma-B regulation protein RsbQ